MKLLPCPFCGSEAIFSPERASQEAYVMCGNNSCDIQPSLYESTDGRAAESWNRRSAVPETAAIRNSALEEAAKVCEDTENVESRDSYYAQLGDASETRWKCAEAIRAIKTQDVGDGPSG